MIKKLAFAPGKVMLSYLRKICGARLNWNRKNIES